MSHVPTTAYRGPRRVMPMLGAAEPQERWMRREVLSWIVGAWTLLGPAMIAPAQVVLAGTDSTAARNAGRDPGLRWQFDTGG